VRANLGLAPRQLHSTQCNFDEAVARNTAPTMLYTLAIVLIILWLLGLVTSYTMSGFVHVLVVIAVILILVRLVRGRQLA
jgi:predicted ferric reductase